MKSVFLHVGMMLFSLRTFSAALPIEKIYSTTQPTVLVFLSSTCPCSHSHIPHLKKLAADYPGFHFQGVHSNADEKKEASDSYFKAQQLPFEVLEDPTSKWADQYKAFKTPHAFILDTGGKILYQGGVSDSSNAGSAEKFFLQLALQDLSAQQDVKIKNGRTLGCVIQRPDEKNIF